MTDFSKEEHSVLDNVEKGNNVLMLGEGGTGKTFLLTYINLRYGEVMNIGLTAMTGIAASHIEGQTLHSFSGIGLGDLDNDKLLKKVFMNKKAKQRWLDVKLLIIDEISMLGAELLEKLDYIAKGIRRNKKPFGGVQLLFSGDFLQLPPIKDKFIFESEIFKTLNLQKIELTNVKRFTDQKYSQALSRIRFGKLTKEDKEMLLTRLKVEINNDLFSVKPTVIYSKKLDVEYENLLELNKLEEDEYKFYSTDSFEGDNERQQEVLLKQLDDCIPSKIKLKRGAQVMLRKNLDVELGLVNGSRGVVLNIKPESDNVEVLFQNGMTIVIGREKWERKDKKEKVKVIREQIPLVLAWCITIHKSQGLTLDTAVCSLADIFEYGQAYVALSRVKSLQGLYISDFEDGCIKANPKVLKYLE